MKMMVQDSVYQMLLWDKFTCNGNDTGRLVSQRRSECAWFLLAKYLPSLKCTAMLIGVYGDSIMRMQHFRKWLKEFEVSGETRFAEMMSHNSRFIRYIGIV
jgi:hypothetical protein